MAFNFKENYNMINFQKESKLVYFDIDETLGSFTAFFDNADNNAFYDEKEKEMFALEKKYNLRSIGIKNYTSPKPECLALLLKLLKETNSKAVCVSSWSVKLRIVANKQMNPVNVLDIIFKSIYPDWEFGYIVALNNVGGERAARIASMTKEHDLTDNYILIDDAVGFYYPADNHTVPVNGNLGYIESDFISSKNKLLANN
jgi:hypothetical protein